VNLELSEGLHRRSHQKGNYYVSPGRDGIRGGFRNGQHDLFNKTHNKKSNLSISKFLHISLLSVLSDFGVDDLHLPLIT
jgi:hypothetical protein